MATVLVTGSNRGIGLELCRIFVGRGDTVFAVCRTESPELAKLGASVVQDIDVTSGASVQELVRQLQGTKLDVVVNNAGILAHESLGDIDYDAVRRQFEANAVAPLRVTEALVPYMAKGAKVALVTSRMGSIADNGSGGMYGYRMSKAALNAAGVSLALDLAPRGVSVIILHPGFVRTQMTGNNGNVEPAEAAAQLVARIDESSLSTTGRFLHANGEPLPW
jgi:NAD(P)-dependent dehydrogenase (short-subunit alcohol dehydrogenase family)